MVVPMSLNALAKSIYQANRVKGFWPENPQERNVGESIALMHSELSEALEAHRKNLESDKLAGVPGLHEEMADTVIRILDFCGGLDIPIAEIIQAKLEYNASRPYKHGKNY